MLLYPPLISVLFSVFRYLSLSLALFLSIEKNNFKFTSYPFPDLSVEVNEN